MRLPLGLPGLPVFAALFPENEVTIEDMRLLDQGEEDCEVGEDWLELEPEKELDEELVGMPSRFLSCADIVQFSNPITPSTFLSENWMQLIWTGSGWLVGCSK